MPDDPLTSLTSSTDRLLLAQAFYRYGLVREARDGHLLSSTVDHVNGGGVLVYRMLQDAQSLLRKLEHSVFYQGLWEGKILPVSVSLHYSRTCSELGLDSINGSSKTRPATSCSDSAQRIATANPSPRLLRSAL
jgi:hypothetical protein